MVEGWFRYIRDIQYRPNLWRLQFTKKLGPLNSTVSCEILSFDQIRESLKVHQRRLKAGDELSSMSELARRAGVHRDTIYAVMKGDRINERTQYALSRVMREIEEETAGKPQTRLLSVNLSQGTPRLCIGLQEFPILRK